MLKFAVILICICFSICSLAKPCLADNGIGAHAARELELVSVDISRHPQDCELYTRRAEIWLSILKPERARKDLEQSLSIKPTPRAYLLLGKSLFDPTDIGPTLKAFENARRLGAGDPQTLMNLGTAYEEMKLPEKQRDVYLAELKINPDDPAALAKVSRTLFKLHQYKETIHYASALLAKAPMTELMSHQDKKDKPIMYEWRKWVQWSLQARGGSYTQLHDFPHALADLNQAEALGTNWRPETYALRADLYKRMGKPELAARDMKAIEVKRDQNFGDLLGTPPK